MAVSYIDNGYTPIEALCGRAKERGAQQIGVVYAEWQDSPRGQVYCVTAELVTKDGLTIKRIGRARPGDAQVDPPVPPIADIWVEDRAEKRALAACIRTAYPDADELEDPDKQPQHIKQAQMFVRKAAERMGITRDALAEIAHGKFKVESLNDLAPEQVDELTAWLEPFVTGEES